MKAILTLLLSVLLLIGCSRNNPGINQIPEIMFEQSYSLNLPQFQPLNSVGGMVMLPIGYRGTFVYRASINEFRAFERTCSWQPLTPCHVLNLDSVSRILLKCACCASSWNFEGQVTSGPASFPLKRYSTLFLTSSNTLNITNP